MLKLSPQEVEERIQAWADVTHLSLELKRAALRKQYPNLSDREISEFIRVKSMPHTGRIVKNDSPLVQSLKELCLFLDEAGIEYTLVGGLAVGIWAAPRATVDIDFLVSIKQEDFHVLAKRLHESGRFIFIHDKPMTFKKVSLLRATLKSNSDISVDFLFADDDFKRQALKRSSAVTVSGFSVKIPTPEDLILLKLQSGRPQDKLDAEKILDMQKDHLNREYIRMWSEKLNIK